MSNICLCLNNIDIEISHCNERSSMEAWRKGGTEKRDQNSYATDKNVAT